MGYFCVPAVSIQLDLTTSHIKTSLFAEEQSEQTRLLVVVSLAYSSLGLCPDPASRVYRLSLPPPLSLCLSLFLLVQLLSLFLFTFFPLRLRRIS